MRKVIAFFMIFISWNLATAENYAVIIGGSGEDFKKENFFLADFDRLNKSLSARGFKVTNVFDSAKTANKFQAISATDNNISNSIKDVMAKAKEGDQVIIMLHTHGKDNPYFRTIGHDILTESGDYNLTELVPHLRSTKAKVLLTDLSCYSGNTQGLIEYEKRKDLESHYDRAGNVFDFYAKSTPLKPQDATKKLCIITAASPKYVSVCSGNKDSNSFTAAILDELEKNTKVSAEDLYKRARQKDRSFTNMPQISSFPKTIKTPWDKWLAKTDPAGLADDEFEMEGKVCEECLTRQAAVIDKTVADVATVVDSAASKQLMEKYKTAVKAQAKIKSDFKTAVIEAFQQLTATEKYKAYKDWSYSKTVFFADLENVTALRGLKPGQPLSKEAEKFLSSFGYFDKSMKMEMMAAMDKKQLLGQFVADLNARIASQKKVRDDNRKQIQEMASKILEYERAQYSKTFKTERGNICQKFQL
jgi:hypothetical protein